MNPRPFKRALAAVLTPVLLIACARKEPPTAAVDGAVAPIETSPLGPRPSAAAASLDAGQRADAGSAPPVAPSIAADAGQTRDRPSSTSTAFEARARALFDAVVHDEPERARAAFFPLPAYEQVKAVGNPAADWRRRLIAAYERDIRDLHVALGNRASRARFVALDVQDDKARWVEPGEEYNKLGYYRVFGSKLRYEVDGRERSFPVKSLISWRGEWYVVHLSAMK